MVNGSVYEIVLLNTRAFSAADRFFAYSPSVSPDNRLIAFVTFYPPHFVEGTDDRYLIYDLGRTPEENRPKGIDTSNHTDVGFPLLPGEDNRPGDNTGVAPQQQHHLIAQCFFWNSDSDRFAFADEYAGQLRLIVASIRGTAVAASAVPVSRREMCLAVQKTDCDVTLANAEFGTDGILVTFQGVGPYSSLRQLIKYQNRQLAVAH